MLSTPGYQMARGLEVNGLLPDGARETRAPPQPARLWPHSGQNFAPGVALAPHSGQNFVPAPVGLPHSGQNFRPRVGA